MTHRRCHPGDPWGPSRSQTPLQRLPGTPHSPGHLSLPLLQADPAVPGALGGQWVPRILPNLAHQGIPATGASVRPSKGETTAPDTRAHPAKVPGERPSIGGLMLTPASLCWVLQPHPNPDAAPHPSFHRPQGPQTHRRARGTSRPFIPLQTRPAL